jgi:hypothetical protein
VIVSQSLLKVSLVCGSINEQCSIQCDVFEFCRDESPTKLGLSFLRSHLEVGTSSQTSIRILWYPTLNKCEKCSTEPKKCARFPPKSV